MIHIDKGEVATTRKQFDFLTMMRLETIGMQTEIIARLQYKEFGWLYFSSNTLMTTPHSFCNGFSKI